MTDRYLFRGKREDNGEWVVGSLGIIPDGRIEIGTKCTDPPDCDPMWQKVLITYEVIPETVGQCTGLKDKNGKLIFENDILLFADDDGEKSSYKVCWSEEYASYTIVTFGATADTMDCWDEHRENFEIIGNVTDNPELSEVEK